MYKYILSAIIIALFIGCSAPSPEKPPFWYTSTPEDSKFFYATGLSIDKLKAKENAILNLRTKINSDLNKAFSNKTSKIIIAQNQDIKPILLENEVFSNALPVMDLEIEETTTFKSGHIILIKLQKNLVFDYAQNISIKKLKDSQVRYETFKNNLAINKYIPLINEIPHYYELASLFAAKELSLLTYKNDDELQYLNEIGSEFYRLKKRISFYILSDVNSKHFVPAVRNAISVSGLNISTQPASDDALKLFITSKTIESQDYSFNKSHTLIKYRTYNQKKEEVAFRQHTFISKSRVSHLDAKKQSVIYEKNKIKRLGVYNFIGLNQ